MPEPLKPPNPFRSFTMTDPIVRVDKDGGIACVTMNRPEALNALNRALRTAPPRRSQSVSNSMMPWIQA